MNGLENKNIYLCGFMGAGKSAVAKRLGLLLGREYLDIDREVEKLENKKIADLFAQKGEAHFRRLEEEMIDWASRSAHRVVSLGGGALLSEKNRQKISASGVLVWLSAKPQVLIARLTKSYLRPLLKPEWLTGEGEASESFAAFLSEREKEYRKAELQFSTDGKTADQTAEEIYSALKERHHLA
jgi:shikimate kinase